nr:MAG TPA: hypothetical protein [Caudoviricetes sp.]
MVQGFLHHLLFLIYIINEVAIQLNNFRRF